MSHFRIIVLLAALAALATAALGCGGSNQGPGEILRSASFEGVESGKVDLALQIKSTGRESGNIDASLSGPFQRKRDFPQVDLTATVKGNDDGKAIDFEGGLTLLSDRGFLNYEGTEYEIDPESFELAKPTFLPLEPNQGKGGSVSALNACLKAAAGLDVGSFGSHLSNDGGAEVGGASTTKISGELDVPAALDALVELAENPSCNAQLVAAGRSADELKKLEGELTGTVKKAHVEIFVGDDGIIRKVAAELAAEPTGNGQDEVEASFELTLSEVNEALKIEAPSSAEPILVWFERFGISPFEAFSVVSESEGLGRLLDLAAANVFPSGARLAGGG